MSREPTIDPFCMQNISNIPPKSDIQYGVQSPNDLIQTQQNLSSFRAPVNMQNVPSDLSNPNDLMSKYTSSPAVKNPFLNNTSVGSSRNSSPAMKDSPNALQHGTDTSKHYQNSSVYQDRVVQDDSLKNVFQPVNSGILHPTKFTEDLNTLQDKTSTLSLTSQPLSVTNPTPPHVNFPLYSQSSMSTSIPSTIEQSVKPVPSIMQHGNVQNVYTNQSNSSINSSLANKPNLLFQTSGNISSSPILQNAPHIKANDMPSQHNVEHSVYTNSSTQGKMLNQYPVPVSSNPLLYQNQRIESVTSNLSSQNNTVSQPNLSNVPLFQSQNMSVPTGSSNNRNFSTVPNTSNSNTMNMYNASQQAFTHPPNIGIKATSSQNQFPQSIGSNQFSQSQITGVQSLNSNFKPPVNDNQFPSSPLTSFQTSNINTTVKTTLNNQQMQPQSFNAQNVNAYTKPPMISNQLIQQNLPPNSNINARLLSADNQFPHPQPNIQTSNANIRQPPINIPTSQIQPNQNTNAFTRDSFLNNQVLHSQPNQKISVNASNANIMPPNQYPNVKSTNSFNANMNDNPPVSTYTSYPSNIQPLIPKIPTSVQNLQQNPAAFSTVQPPLGIQNQPNYNQQQHLSGPVHMTPQHVSTFYNGQQDTIQPTGRYNVTQTGMNKLWGNETLDLLQCRNIMPEGKVEPPVIKLNNHFSQSANCNPEIFRCTLTKIPETNNLLQKSRLPLGILIHPFKDLTHLPVIQCSSIVRCRSCRTYINPFVYFIDLKRWKCNLCYRVNDLPEEFLYDPVTKTYGDPTRRPEIQSATIEYIAPSEYMLRPPQPAAYLFLLDVSANAVESGYLKLFCETLTEQIDNLPGDSRTQLAFICYDSAVHFYFLGENASRPKEMTVIDIEDVFLPSPNDLLINLAERRSAILELLSALPNRHANPSPAATQSALGAALQAALKLMTPTGGRVTVFQTCLPNVGPGALSAREDPNNRSSKDVAHLNPATDFYKRHALNCSGVQIAVDLFLLNSQYADLSTISGVSRFSGGTVYHLPLFKTSREWQYQELKRCFTRYLSRKIGFEAVMRVRCTRGLAIHAFHGSFFVRSTDLLSLPNISPDAGFGMQLAIEENLSDTQHVCFQAALLYTSSKGERRIRVHTLCLPVTGILTDVIHSADQQCIIGLLAKMAVDRSQTSSISDAREALLNAAVDALGAIKTVSGPSHGLMCPIALRLLPLYLLALLKYKAFRTGTSTRLDDRIAAMCSMKSLPLENLIRSIYPDLYPVHRLSDYSRPICNDNETESDEISIPNPPRLRLSAEKVSATGAYILDQEDSMVLYIGHTVHVSWLKNTLGVESHSQIPDDSHSIPTLETDENALLHAFIDHLNDEKPYAATLHVIRDNAPNRSLFVDKLVDDRIEAALSYYEFVQHVKNQMK